MRCGGRWRKRPLTRLATKYRRAPAAANPRARHPFFNLHSLLTTEEIARAYLAPAPTIAPRIVRAKAKIRDEAIPYEVPRRAELPAQIESALSVVYLSGGSASSKRRGPPTNAPSS